MFERIIKTKNQFLDWFITEKERISTLELYTRRRFIEAILLALIATSIGWLFKLLNIHQSFPNELGMLFCIMVLLIYRQSSNTILAGNIFVGFFYFTMTYDIIYSQSEIVTYFRWLLVLPVFSYLFINKNSGIFWVVTIILTTALLALYPFGSNSILANDRYRVYFASDSILYYSIFLTLIYVYFQRKELINQALKKEQIELDQKAQDLMRAQNQLLEVNEDLKTYAHVVSHDLKTPLRGILGFSEIIYTKVSSGEPLDEDNMIHLKFIKDNAVQMEELITDILRFAELRNNPSREFRAVDLNQLLDQSVKNFTQEEIQDSLIIHRIDLPKIKVIPSQIKQVFQNLISNSIKFAKENQAPKIEIFQEDKGAFIQFTFKDNGIGVEPENLEYIFLPFKKLNSPSKYSGSGIGLANCAKVVARHGGKIWAESRENEGLTIHFTILKEPLN